MKKQFEILKKTREYLLEFVRDLSVEQLNEIPTGFNNNIIWNMGHMIAAQQGVCYKRSGLALHISEEFFLAYKPDSKPEGLVSAEEIEKIKALLLSSINQLETDYANHVFANYTPWTNRYGIEHTTIEDTLCFLPYHEGLHLGYVMALKRLINKQ